MNVLLTTVSLDSRAGGGTAERTRRLARHLVLQGHGCTVATMEDGDLADELRAIGVAVYVAPVIRLRFRVPLINIRQLAKAVRTADVIHILGYWNLLSIVTARLAVYYRKPYAFSAAGEFVGLDRPRPVPRMFHWLLGRRMLRNARLFVAITELERSQILGRFRLSPDEVIVVPNGVELSPPAAGSTDHLPGKPFILFVGRLAEVKGPDLLLEAYADIAGDHPEVELVIGGPDFGMEHQLRLKAVERNLADKVTFTGHLDEAARTAAYQRALFLTVPSRAEAMSLVAVEAGAAGTPVLLTDQCGFDEVEAIGGGAVVPATVDGLADGMRMMLARGDALREDGQRLRDHVERTYAWPAIVAGLVSRLEHVISAELGEGRKSSFLGRQASGDSEVGR